MSQPRKSYTGEQKRFMEAVSSNGYGGVCHVIPTFIITSGYKEGRIITSEPNSLTERDTVKVSEQLVGNNCAAPFKYYVYNN